MNERYLKAAREINEAALTIACQGHQVETTFHSNYVAMSLTIFFDDISFRNHLDTTLRRYAAEDDEIDFHEYKSAKPFYTLRLTKNPSRNL